MSKSMSLYGYIFLGIGILLLTLAGMAFSFGSAFDNRAVRTQGTVIAMKYRGDGMSSPVVQWFDQNGELRRFVSSTSTSRPAYDRGDTLTVLYDPDKPRLAVIDSFLERYTGAIISGGIGLVFSLIGGPILYFYWRRAWMIRWLKKHGTEIEARFVRCDLDRSSTTNGRNPYRVHAQGKHPRTGKNASFKSEPIWLDLTEELKDEVIPVLINRKKHGPHYIDLSQWVHDSERA